MWFLSCFLNIKIGGGLFLVSVFTVLFSAECIDGWIGVLDFKIGDDTTLSFDVMTGEVFVAILYGNLQIEAVVLMISLIMELF